MKHEVSYGSLTALESYALVNVFCNRYINFLRLGYLKKNKDKIDVFSFFY